MDDLPELLPGRALLRHAETRPERFGDPARAGSQRDRRLHRLGRESPRLSGWISSRRRVPSLVRPLRADKMHAAMPRHTLRIEFLRTAQRLSLDHEALAWRR